MLLVFSANRSLKVHIRKVHEGKRPFECELCPKNVHSVQHSVASWGYPMGGRGIRVFNEIIGVS